MTIAACIIAKNEGQALARTLQSVAWCDEVVVVDSGSTDDTVAVARRFTDRVYHRDWTGFADQKNHAAEKASSSWIFSVDADEVCSGDLGREVRAAVAAGTGEKGFRLPRRTFFMGRWIRFTDWSPDWQLRLYERGAGRWQGGRVHESVAVEGPVGRLRTPLLHYSYDDLGDYLRKLELYTRLSAQDMNDRGRRSSVGKILFSPLAAWARSYLLKQGFRDGFPGLVIAGLSAASVFFRYARLRELQSGGRPADRPGQPGRNGA